MHLSKCLVVFGDEQDALSPLLALFHRVEKRRTLRQVDDLDVLVLARQFSHGFGLARRGPVDRLFCSGLVMGLEGRDGFCRLFRAQNNADRA